jgi:hypothetical protein
LQKNTKKKIGKKKKIILEKKMKKNGKKKHVGKVKAKFSTSSILKKKSTKIILKKNMWGNTVAKQKQYRETL